MKLLYMNTDLFENKDLFEEGMRLISADRREKISKMKNPVSARLSLAAGLLLRFALESNGLLSQLNEIQYGKHGKPYLNIDSFYFSLSHSGTYAVCAYSDTNIGIDLQKIKHELPKSTKKILSHAENKYLFSLKEEEQPKLFYRLWSIKESLIKYDGRGLRLPLNEISIIANNKIIDNLIFENRTLYFTESELLFPDYVLCFCTERKQKIEMIRKIDAKFLTKN